MRACHRLFTAVCALLLLLLNVQSASAQGRVADYVLENFSSSFSSISGTGNQWFWYSPWSASQAISLPFNFPFDNTTINAGTTIYATSSGTIAFTGTFPSYGQNTGQGSASYPQLLSFLGGSLSTGDRHNGYYDHYWQTQGVSPNRVLVIELRNIHFVCAANGSGSGPANYSTHVQVRLYETTGHIEFIYSQPGRSLGSNCFTAPSIGLNGRSSPSFSFKTLSQNVTTVPSSHIRLKPPPPPAQLSVQPKSLNYGSVTAGVPSTLCATIRSVGTNPLTINSTSLAGPPDYQIVSGPAPGTVLQPGASTNICISFNPIAAGTRTATLAINSNGADSGSQQVSLTGIGIAPSIDVPTTDFFRKTKITVGDSVTVAIPFQSTGTGPLSLTGFQWTGGDIDQYSIKRAPTTPMAPGVWDSIYITFKPTFEGRHDATLRVNNNSVNLPQFTLRFYGIAIMPRLSVTPMNLSFDSILIGETVCKEVILANPGTDTVNILRVIQTFADKDYTFTPLLPSDTVIRPEEQKVYRICFTPTNIGTRLARVTFYSDIIRTIPDNRDTSQFTVNVTGVGVPFGRVMLSGTVTNSAVVGTENCVVDSIRNVGSADITISGFTLTGANANEYSVSGLNLPKTLKPMQAIPFNYCVTPTEAGPRAGTLVLTGTSAGEVLTVPLPLNGIGVQVCAKTDLSAIFEMTAVGQSDTASVTVTNCGDLATTYTGVLGSGSQNYTILSASTSQNVDAGSTTTFEIMYAPIAVGANTSTLTITGNGPGSTPMTVALNGVGAGVVVGANGGNAGNVVVTECEEFTITLSNNGNVDWTPGTPQFTGTDASEFAFVSLNPPTIEPGSNGTLTLRYCPTELGNSSAAFNFPNAIPEPVPGFNHNIFGSGVQSGGVGTSTASRGFELGQNHPNPLTKSTSFRVVIPHETMVRIDLFDQTGAHVRNVISERMSGDRTIELDASTLASGTYSYVLTSGDVRLVRQLTIVR